MQRGKPALSSALPGRPRTCQRLGKAIACILISTAGSWWLWIGGSGIKKKFYSTTPYFEQPPKRCCSPDFCTKHIVGKSLFRTKWKCFGFENETRNGEMAGVQSWPKCWLSGSCPRAQCQRWWTLNICHSVVSCLILKLMYPSREDASNNVLNLKSDQIWRRLVHFFRGNGELNSSFPCQLYRRRIGGQLTLV